MLSRVARSWLPALLVLVVVGGVLGAALGRGAWAGGLDGALLGLAVALAVGVHLLVRSAAGRGVEASAPESAADSVERRVWTTASSATCADAVSVMVFVALLSLGSGGAPWARWLPLAGLVIVLVDLLVRSCLAWRAQVGGDA